MFFTIFGRGDGYAQPIFLWRSMDGRNHHHSIITGLIDSTITQLTINTRATALLLWMYDIFMACLLACLALEILLQF
jgi:hypothetical protein